MRFPFAMAAARLPGPAERDLYASALMARRYEATQSFADRLAAAAVQNVRRKHQRGLRGY